MKRLFTFMAVLTLFVTTACADEKKEIITVNQLPQSSQTFLNTNFAGITAVSVIKETDWPDVDYEVILANGAEVDFNKDGVWKNVDCKKASVDGIQVSVPDSIIPAQIKEKVAVSFPTATIVEIDVERKGYEVKLNIGTELKFDRNFTMKLDD